MKNFGANSQKDLEKIARIITEEQMDVVALQEILSEGKGIKRLLEQCVKYELYDWDFCWASPQESTDLDKIKDMIVNDTRGECYAYLWNKKKFKLAEMTRFGQRRIFELRFINIHIYYGDNRLSSLEKRSIEYDILTHDIYPDLSTKRYGDFRTAYTVAMGDYNLNIYTPGVVTSSKNYLAPVYSYCDGDRKINVLTEQKGLSTLSRQNVEGSDQTLRRYANNYDHFTYSPELSGFNKVSFEVVDAVNKYCNSDFEYYNDNISDHLPIVMTIDI